MQPPWIYLFILLFLMQYRSYIYFEEWPIPFHINMFTALKGSVLFLFAITAASVVPCGGPEKSPRTSSIVQIIFSYWSFEISERILRNQKITIGLDSFSNQRLMTHLDYTSHCIDYPVENCKIKVILFDSILPNL